MKMRPAMDGGPAALKNANNEISFIQRCIKSYLSAQEPRTQALRK